GVVDNVIDDVGTRRADVLMHQDIAGAVVVEIADATHADVSAKMGDSGAGYNSVVVYCEYLQRSHPTRRILMHQDVIGAVAVEVARAVDLPVPAKSPQDWGGLDLHPIHRQRPQRRKRGIDLMLQDVAGAIPIEVADAVHLPVRTVHID